MSKNVAQSAPFYSLKLGPRPAPPSCPFPFFVLFILKFGLLFYPEDGSSIFLRILIVDKTTHRSIPEARNIPIVT
jgi:hypothetical protein